MRVVHRWSWLLVLLIFISACSLAQQPSTPTVPAPLPTAVVVEAVPTQPQPPSEPLPCDQIVSAITARVDAACSTLGRNQACYGSRQVTAQFVNDSPLSRFESSGDIVNLSELSRISASPFDTLTQDWGIALIKAQANLPDTLPGQNVLIMLMGDTEVLNMTPGLQAVTFRSGVGDVSCAAAPPSAILVQSPEGQLITMNINGADVTMGSTLYFTAEVENQLTIGVLEGSGLIEVDGTARYLLPGQQVGLPLGGELGLQVIGVPSLPEPIPLAQVENSPLELLERPINLPDLPAAVPVDDLQATLIPETLTPTPDSTTPACTVRADWTASYSVEPGDTLFRISLRAGVSLSELQIGNCISDTNQIEVGQVLRAPLPVSTSTPVPLDQTLTAISSFTPTATSASPTQTFTPTAANFRADQMVVVRGQCTTLRWDVDNITAVYIDGQPTIGHSSQVICPTRSTTYILTVIHPDARQQTYSVTVTVSSGTITITPSFTPSPTWTPSFVPTITITPTVTPVPTFTFTPMPTITPAFTPTGTVAPTVTIVPTATSTICTPLPGTLVPC